MFATLSVIDGGDLAITPGNARADGRRRSPRGSRPVIDAGAIPLVLGGDHSIVLGELRAHAARHGPVGVVLLDAHADTWEAVLRRALLPRHAVQARARGGPDRPAPLAAGRHARPALRRVRPRRAALVGLRDRAVRRAARRWTPAEYGARVRERDRRRAGVPVVRHRRARPGLRAGHRDARGRRACCPHEAIAFLRALAGVPFVGFDVVEVSPPYDGPGQVTALTGASIAYELLALQAVAAAAG